MALPRVQDHLIKYTFSRRTFDVESCRATRHQNYTCHVYEELHPRSYTSPFVGKSYLNVRTHVLSVKRAVSTRRPPCTADQATQRQRETGFAQQTEQTVAEVFAVTSKILSDATANWKWLRLLVRKDEEAVFLPHSVSGPGNLSDLQVVVDL